MTMIRKFLAVTILFLVIQAASFAQSIPVVQAGSLNIFSVDSPFLLYVNGELYNEQPSMRIRIENLTRPTVDIRVEFSGRSSSRSSSVYDETIRMLNDDKTYVDVTYSTGVRKRGLSLYALFPLDDRMPVVSTFETYKFGFPAEAVSPNVIVAEQPADEIRMDEKEFAEFLVSVKRPAFDSKRLEIAKVAVQEVSFTTEQVRLVMRQFGWDDAKLSFAKLAYPKCLDKRNYTNLMREFTFKGSEDNLLKYIKSQQ